MYICMYVRTHGNCSAGYVCMYVLYLCMQVHMVIVVPAYLVIMEVYI